MEFIITDYLKSLPNREELVDMFTAIDSYAVQFAKFDVLFDDSMEIADFITFARNYGDKIFYTVKNYKAEDLIINAEFGMENEVGLWEQCTSDYGGAILTRINEYLLKYHKLPDDEETQRHSARKDSAAIINYNNSVVQSGIENYAQEIDLYCEGNGRLYKLAKTIDISGCLKDIEAEVRKLRQEVKDEVDIIMNSNTEPEPEPQNEDDDEYAVEEPVANIFVKADNSEIV